MHSSSQWANILRARFIRKIFQLSTMPATSILPTIKCHLQDINLHTVWILGDGSKVNFWRDRWLDEPVVNLIHILDFLHSHM